ncbi:MAG: hypothetical protein ABJB40_08625 [Acidobacteriota bacterium]
MPELDEQQLTTRSVWENIRGSEALLKIYGYYPTLHDAYVVGMQIQFETRSLYMLFEYSDLVQRPGADEETANRLIGIRWGKVATSELRIYANDIYDMEFSRVGDFIETTFMSSFSICGSIRSQEIQVDLVDDSKRDQYSPNSTYLHTINFQLGD